MPGCWLRNQLIPCRPKITRWNFVIAYKCYVSSYLSSNCSPTKYIELSLKQIFIPSLQNPQYQVVCCFAVIRAFAVQPHCAVQGQQWIGRRVGVPRAQPPYTWSHSVSRSASFHHSSRPALWEWASTTYSHPLVDYSLGLLLLSRAVLPLLVVAAVKRRERVSKGGVRFL